MTISDESSKKFVERVFPSAKGTIKGSLILAHGLGFDSGIASAIDLLKEMFAEFDEGITLKEALAKIGEKHLMTRDPAPCGHCGATDHDTAHCPGNGG